MNVYFVFLEEEERADTVIYLRALTALTLEELQRERKKHLPNVARIEQLDGMVNLMMHLLNEAKQYAVI